MKKARKVKTGSIKFGNLSLRIGYQKMDNSVGFLVFISLLVAFGHDGVEVDDVAPSDQPEQTHRHRLKDDVGQGGRSHPGTEAANEYPCVLEKSSSTRAGISQLKP